MSAPYFTELVQADPADSPTPGASHYAGGKAFDDLTEAVQWGRAQLGQPVHEDVWDGCCDWQSRFTPIAGWIVVDNELRGETIYAQSGDEQVVTSGICPACGNNSFRRHPSSGGGDEHLVICNGCAECWFPRELETPFARLLRRLRRKPHPNHDPSGLPC